MVHPHYTPNYLTCDHTVLLLNSDGGSSFPHVMCLCPWIRYCQDPSPSRTDTLYRTSYCQVSCPSTNALPKDPVCCSSEAGEDCATSERSGDASLCDAHAKPWDCVSATPGAPTEAENQRRSREPVGHEEARRHMLVAAALSRSEVLPTWLICSLALVS